jgi:RHS repeat-associated protein
MGVISINRKPDMSVLSSYTYGYDYNYTTSSYTMKGYRTSMTNHLAQIEKYYFDNLYQLTRVDYGNGDVHQWSYDDIGNRVQQVVIPSGQPPVVTNYTYYQNGQSRNSQLLQSDGLSTYTWDNNGNLSAKAATQYTWDYDDRLVGISGPSVNASYVYNFQGNRIKKTVSGAETAYLYLSEDIAKETTGGVVTNYLQGIGIDEPVMMERAGAKSYYFSDGLGSIRELTDSVGTIQNNYTYGAWGELRAQNVTAPNNYGYTGREFAEEGSYFYRARYLDPGVGRFVSKDPIGFRGGMNLYGYVANNPVNYSDYNGNQQSGRSVRRYWPGTETDRYNCMAWALFSDTWQPPIGDPAMEHPNLVPPRFHCRRINCSEECSPCDEYRIQVYEDRFEVHNWHVYRRDGTRWTCKYGGRAIAEVDDPTEDYRDYYRPSMLKITCWCCPIPFPTEFTGFRGGS